jgi:hypothetical protein
MDYGRPLWYYSTSSSVESQKFGIEYVLFEQIGLEIVLTIPLELQASFYAVHHMNRITKGMVF